MVKAWAVAVLSASALALGGTEGCSGGDPLPGQDDGSCTVTARQANSKGVYYVEVTCEPGGNQATELLPGNDNAAWSGCVVGSFWPACKEA